jgi:hypothetical protein
LEVEKYLSPSSVEGVDHKGGTSHWSEIELVREKESVVFGVFLEEGSPIVQRARVRV